jgi:hypothetical protein
MLNLELSGMFGKGMRGGGATLMSLLCNVVNVLNSIIKLRLFSFCFYIYCI